MSYTDPSICADPPAPAAQMGAAECARGIRASSSAASPRLRFMFHAGQAQHHFRADRSITDVLHVGTRTVETEVVGKSFAYLEFVRKFEDGEDGPKTYSWDDGVAP